MPTPPIADDVLRTTAEMWEKHKRVVAHAAKEVGVSESTFRRRLQISQERLGATRPANGPAAPHHSGGRSLSEFRETHDKGFIVPKKISAALAALGGGWDYEMPFAKLAGVSLGDLSAYRSMFEDHIVVVEKTKRAWAGTKATAEKMREMVR